MNGLELCRSRAELAGFKVSQSETIQGARQEKTLLELGDNAVRLS